VGFRVFPLTKHLLILNPLNYYFLARTDLENSAEGPPVCALRPVGTRRPRYSSFYICILPLTLHLTALLNRSVEKIDFTCKITLQKNCSA
jgi:hypothetical protein